MRRARIATALAAAGLVSLAACTPEGRVSPSGQNWIVTFYKDHALQVAPDGTQFDWVRAAALCHGASAWSYSPQYHFTASSPASVELVVGCGEAGVAAGSWEEW